jgi:hypothetical protein
VLPINAIGVPDRKPVPGLKLNPNDAIVGLAGFTGPIA